MQKISTHPRLAILIDADNVSAKIIEPLLRFINKLGTANAKRIYGDWTNTQLSSWKIHVHRLGIQPIQQFQYTSGKNSTDSALIIDAMDLLYTGKFDGFCLVSSDGDFTRLACRIRESGLLVYGFGEKQKTPPAFIAACYRFYYININSETKPENLDIPPLTSLKTNQKLIQLLKSAYQAAKQEGGWTNLSMLVGELKKLEPNFSSKNYGCSKFSQLIQEVACFDIQSSNNVVKVRLK